MPGKGILEKRRNRPDGRSPAALCRYPLTQRPGVITAIIRFGMDYFDKASIPLITRSVRSIAFVT